MKFLQTILHPIVFTLRLFSRLLLHGPPIAYLVMYLSLILIFTFIFFFIRGDFYHSTIKNEPHFHNQKMLIINEMKEALIKEIQIRHPDGNIKNEKYEFHTNLLRARSLKVEGDFASFVLFAHLPQKHSSTKMQNYLSNIYWGVRVSFDINPVYYKQNETEPGEELIWIPHILLTFEQLGSIRSEDYVPPIPLTEVFDTFEAFDKKKHMYLSISPELSKKILAYADGVRGKPIHLPGNFIRMLYLSSVTITTLGYGDIVPLTTCARLFITIEAILGIVLIGLFLNSLRNSFSRKN